MRKIRACGVFLGRFDVFYANNMKIFSHLSPRQLTLVLRSAGGVVLQKWTVNGTLVPHGNSYDLHFSGGPYIWLNDRSRRVEVQLSVYEYNKLLVRYKPKKIRAGECFVLKNPSYLYNVSHDKTRVRGNGMT